MRGACRLCLGALFGLTASAPKFASEAPEVFHLQGVLDGDPSRAVGLQRSLAQGARNGPAPTWKTQRKPPNISE